MSAQELGGLREMPYKAPEPGFLCAPDRTWPLRPVCNVEGQRFTLLGARAGISLGTQLSEQGTSHTQ